MITIVAHLLGSGKMTLRAGTSTTVSPSTGTYLIQHGHVFVDSHGMHRRVIVPCIHICRMETERAGC